MARSLPRWLLIPALGLADFGMGGAAVLSVCFIAFSFSMLAGLTLDKSRLWPFLLFAGWNYGLYRLRNLLLQQAPDYRKALGYRRRGWLETLATIILANAGASLLFVMPLWFGDLLFGLPSQQREGIAFIPLAGTLFGSAMELMFMGHLSDLARNPSRIEPRLVVLAQKEVSKAEPEAPPPPITGKPFPANRRPMLALASMLPVLALGGLLPWLGASGGVAIHVFYRSVGWVVYLTALTLCGLIATLILDEPDRNPIEVALDTGMRMMIPLLGPWIAVLPGTILILVLPGLEPFGLLVTYAVVHAMVVGHFLKEARTAHRFTARGPADGPGRALAAWLPQPEVTDPSGQRIPADRVFFVAPPPEIGTPVHAITTLRADTIPLTTEQRAIWCLAGAVLAGVGGLAIGVTGGLERDLLVPWCLLTAGYGAGIVWWSSRFSESCIIVGSAGFARISATGSEPRVEAITVMPFSAATALYSSRTIFTSSYVARVPTGEEAIRFVWRDDHGCQLLVLNGAAHRRDRGGGLAVDLALAVEAQWIPHRLARYRQEIADTGFAQFITDSAVLEVTAFDVTLVLAGKRHPVAHLEVNKGRLAVHGAGPVQKALWSSQASQVPDIACLLMLTQEAINRSSGEGKN
ncbi:MAG: hypothetical protein WCJ64_15790 [Rhodospirillaceae bacterium]